MLQQYKRPPFVWVGLAIAIVAFAGFALSKNSNKEPEQYLTPISSFQDAHGMAVDVADSSKVYIATHHGLLMMQNDKDLYRVGSGRDDYMGFSVHPTDPNAFFTSGHPSMGGNLGFQKSEDGGRSWQRVSSGANGPVDFHSMAVGQVDPSTIYGTYQGKLQRSQDGGTSWNILESAPANIISLAADTKDNDTVYATTTDGLYVSRDQGNEWSALPEISNTVTAIAVNPENNQELLAYVQDQGLLHSADSGGSWSPLPFAAAQNTPVMYLSYDKQSSSTIYALLQNLTIHKTTDSGKTWKQVR